MITLKKEKRELARLGAIVLLALAWNMTVYWGSRLVTYSWNHHNIMTQLDRKISLVPWTVVIYLGCYLFWGVNYWICADQPDHERIRFYTADALAKAVCCLVFFLYPTTNTRPEYVGSGFWGFAMKLLYWIDSPDNLFPSIHCLVSWLCWVGVRNRKDISAWYRCASLGMALAVCISTLTTRQHVIVDVIGGIALAEASYQLARIPALTRCYAKPTDWVLKKLDKLF